MPWITNEPNEKNFANENMVGNKIPMHNGYFPSPSDDQTENFRRIHVNLHLAGSPSFNGFGFSYPETPLSTNGNAPIKASLQFYNEVYC